MSTLVSISQAHPQRASVTYRGLHLVQGGNRKRYAAEARTNLYYRAAAAAAALFFAMTVC